jgi:hypothetical protein
MAGHKYAAAQIMAAYLRQLGENTNRGVKNRMR